MIFADNPPLNEIKSTIPAVIQKTINDDFADIEFPMEKPAKIEIEITRRLPINQFEALNQYRKS